MKKKILLLQAVAFSLLFCIEAMASEVMVFPRSWMLRGNYKDLPQKEELAQKQVKFTGCRGEYCTAQLLLRCDEEAVVKATVKDDLRDASNHTLSSKYIIINEVLDQKRWHNPRQFERLPYLLMPRDTFQLKAKQTSRMWLTLQIPQNTPAGCYQGVIELTRNGSVIKEFSLSVTVRPFDLKPVPSTIYCLCPCWGAAIFPEWVNNPTYLDKLFRCIKANKINGMACSYKTPEDLWPYMTAADMVKNGTYIWIGAWNHLDKMRRTYEMCQKDGCRLLLYGQDEPNDEAKRNTQRYLTKLFRQHLPECKVITSLQTGTVDAIGDALDVWEPEAIDLDDAFVTKAASQNKELWAYECRLAPVDALNSRFFHGMLAWRTGLKGTIFWYLGGLDCGYGFIKDRYGVRVKDYTQFNGDWQYNFDYLVFLPEGLYYTVGWVAMRDGMQDMEYLYNLRLAIEQARSKGFNRQADEAEKVLKELRQSIHPEIYGQTFWKAYKSDNKFRNGELGVNFFRPAPEFTPADFIAWREKLASAIEMIESTMKDDRH